MDGAQKLFTDASRYLTLPASAQGKPHQPCLPVTYLVALQLYSGPCRTEDCCCSGLFHTAARHNPLVTKDTLASSEYNLPQAVVLTL